MSRNNHAVDWYPEEHPSLDVLRQYQAGELPAPLHRQVAEHLATCELCSDLSEGLALSKPANLRSAVRETRGRLKQLLAQKKRKRRSFQWPIWQTAAVLLVLLFAIAEVVYHHYFANSDKPRTEQKKETPSGTAISGAWMLRGNVMSESDAVLSGANVQVRGQGAAVNTNSNGFFEIEVKTESAVIVVTKAGFVPKEMTVQKTHDWQEIKLSRTD
ncbi:hypothetical protein EFA69_19605 [Rufibacter immobilis]|uniref:Zinc-finger domain-containing protein n=1 Tax=Rufibacter immobilis TaxID=1348778 RepID=A0A3M9MRX8_9BACT|nr:carboxypeptidase-like regulatory domain-containing protein [Rufibacter immobilis]RNI28270.1 hypothetical protein EFA69_19605 [Rufibacter immobilis]